MDIVLVSGRPRAQTPHHSRARTGILAREFALIGHRVRWLCPVTKSGGPAVHLPDRATFLPVVTSVPQFRDVHKTLTDVPTDRALSLLIRERLPDIVHVLAFGGTNSCMTAWIADRLGVPTVVSVHAGEVLCHRGTLIDDRGQSCRAFADPKRCQQCCLTPFAGGLTATEAKRARRQAWRGAWSSFPMPEAYETRLDLVLGGLAAATCLLVDDDDQREVLVSAGIPARVLRRTPPEAGQLAALYAEVAALAPALGR